MKLSHFLLPQAEADIDKAIDFIARHDAEKAVAFDRAVFESLDLLCTMAKIGTPYPTSNQKLAGLRMWFVKGFEKYLIFYIPYGNYIEVVRVLHSAQDRDSILLELE
jgi:toxin ParE1/3/4